MQMDRESIIANAAASYNKLKTKQIRTQVWILFYTRIYYYDLIITDIICFFKVISENNSGPCRIVACLRFQVDHW